MLPAPRRGICSNLDYVPPHDSSLCLEPVLMTRRTAGVVSNASSYLGPAHARVWLQLLDQCGPLFPLAQSLDLIAARGHQCTERVVTGRQVRAKRDSENENVKTRTFVLTSAQDACSRPQSQRGHLTSFRPLACTHRGATDSTTRSETAHLMSSQPTVYFSTSRCSPRATLASAVTTRGAENPPGHFILPQSLARTDRTVSVSTSRADSLRSLTRSSLPARATPRTRRLWPPSRESTETWWSCNWTPPRKRTRRLPPSWCETRRANSTF